MIISQIPGDSYTIDFVLAPPSESDWPPEDMYANLKVYVIEGESICATMQC
jgi:hypothetical protein